MPRAAAARATAISPSGWTDCTPVGEISTGSEIVCPITVVVMSRAGGRSATWGANPSSLNAARLSASVTPASEPAISAEYTDFGRCRLARRWATATDSNHGFLPNLMASAGPRAGSRRRGGLGLGPQAPRRPSRHVHRRLRDRGVAPLGEEPLAVAEHAFGVGAGQRQPREELRRHAPPAAFVEQPAARARAGVLRLAQLAEQLGLAPHALEAAGVANVAGEELVVDHERARIHVSDRIDQAHHAPGSAQVQPGQRRSVAAQVEERVSGEHAARRGASSHSYSSRCCAAVGCSRSHTSAPRPDGRRRVSRSCAPNPSASSLNASSWGTFSRVTTTDSLKPAKPASRQVLHRADRGRVRPRAADSVVDRGGRAVERDLHVDVIGARDPGGDRGA